MMYLLTSSTIAYLQPFSIAVNANVFASKLSPFNAKKMEPFSIIDIGGGFSMDSKNPAYNFDQIAP